MSANAPALPELLTTREAAAFLRISVPTLERLRASGAGCRYRKLGPGKRARVVYAKADLIAWLETQSFQSTAEYGVAASR